MPKTITKTVYEYDELPTEKAKERALNWYLEGAFDNEWWQSTYDDAAHVGIRITSFDLDRNKRAEGDFINHADACAEKILEEHGETCGSYKTAKDYLAKVKAIVDGMPDSDDFSETEDELEELASEFLRAILEEYASMLQKEADYMSSREYLEEGIRANEYTFDKNGKREG